MTELEIKTNERKQSYLEYRGKKLTYMHNEEWMNDLYDIFDMRPQARAGFAKHVDVFTIDCYNMRIVSDSDNLAKNFKFFAEEDDDDKSFKIIMQYEWMSRGGRSIVEVCKIDVFNEA